MPVHGNAVLRLEQQNGLFGLRTVEAGDAVGIIPERTQTALNALDIRSVVIQLDAVLLGVVLKQRLLQLGGGNAGLRHIRRSLKQKNCVLRRFVEQRSGLVALHVTEVHQLLLQRLDVRVVVSELQRGILRNGDAAVGRGGCRFLGWLQGHRRNILRFSDGRDGKLLRRQILGLGVGGLKQAFVVISKQKKQGKSADDRAKQNRTQDAQ